MFVVSPSIVQTIINFSSILVSSDRLRVAAPSLLIIWFANDRRLVVSVLLLFIFFVLVKPSSAGIDRRVRSDPRGLLGANDLRAGARDRGWGPTRRTRTSPTGSTRNTCPGGN